MLRFDFNQQTLCFESPLYIIESNDIGSVVEQLKKVEEAVDAGFYAAGFVAYEAASAFDPALKTLPHGKMPLLWFGIYDKPTINPPVPAPSEAVKIDSWQLQTSFEDYQQAIKHIRDEIKSGNTYQVNYTTELISDFKMDGYDFYHTLRQAQQANYTAFLDIGEYQIISASPELFFHWQNEVLTTKPMKGTISRGLSVEQDQKQHQILKNSLKDQAENIMIVDLLRNDLSKVAMTGTVQVDKLFEIEQYPTVWQMTSTITAKTKPSATLLDIFTALFPCGSITGAPKANTMRIISELEQQPREVYCGAIGYITPEKEAIFNVPIRTVWVDKKQQKAHYGVGGGITWDSTSSNEYQEVIQKTKVLAGIRLPERLLESLKLENGAYVLFDEHLDRLENSASYFGFKFDRVESFRQLNEFAQNHEINEWKVRLLLSQDGAVLIEGSEISAIKEPLYASWAEAPINSSNVLFYHKTIDRSIYPTATLNQEYLLFNERSEITEFTNGNVALLIDNEWLTPPISSGLLNGTMRASLLKTGKLKEAVLLKEQLSTATKIAFLNSVRGWRDVIWQD